MNEYVREYQKIERRRRRRDSFLLRYLPVLLILAAGVVVGKIYMQSVAIRWSERLVTLQHSAAELEFENEELGRAIATLTTRERIVRDASRRLGMESPGDENLFWLTVVDAGVAPAPPESAEPARGALSVLRVWFDRLLQEEALALTNGR